MAPDSAANLTSLLRASSIDDHEEVLRAANAALKISKLDTGAQRTRVVALLKLDRFEDALRALADGGATLDADCRLEKAYALYKTGKLDDAASLAASTTGRSFSHVAAQVAYRAERFQDARQLYDELASDKAAAAEEESDLSINVLATAAQRDWQSQAALTSGFVQPPVAPALDTFELAYNLACGCIARGELSKASSLLQRASRLCDESDDLSDEEKRAEMAPILIQQAYVYSRLGNTTEALKLHRQLEASEISDAEARLVATNNASTLDNTASNPFAVQRTLEANPAVSNDAKLFHYQDSRLRRNKLALALRAQKFSGVARQTKHLISASSPSSTASSDANVLSVINVAARSLEHSSQVSLRDVLPAAERHPADVGVLLTAIQLHVLAKNYEAAVRPRFCKVLVQNS
ncbi:Signal recognition particle subunit SRP72 like protein [Verticillium longisporum]|nr:Signal recognition particle subunit SRP72 like protein [Verticillium longisporum]